MARLQKITAGEINIRLHPHPDRIYASFIEAIYELRQPIRVFGDRVAIISLLNRAESGTNIYTGFITVFTRNDMTDPWFDISTLEEADDNKVSQISIPEDVFPNSSAFPFLFDTDKHRFFVQTYSKGKTLSVNLVAKLLGALSENLNIIHQFGEAKITVVQSKAGLERVFSLPVIKRLTFVIVKPNADILDDDFDENVEGFLEELNSKRLTIIVDADAGKSIKPNDELRRIGASTLEHGSARADGRDLKGATSISTKDFPKPLHDKYDPDQTTEGLAFRRLTGR